MGFEYFPEGDGRSMSITSIGDAWTLEEIRDWVVEAIRPCEWIHVAPLMRDEFPVEAIAELSRERVLSFDGQGLARQPRLGPLALDSAFDRELLRYISVLKLSEEEAEAIVGKPTAKALAEIGVAEIVVTLGSRGSLVYSDGELTPVPARPVVANVDTTGAGDEYAAVYLAARSRGRSPVLAARRASAFVGAMLSRRLPVA
jgi:sugar/nucleoside kinase (ribokinase family)